MNFFSRNWGSFKFLWLFGSVRMVLEGCCRLDDWFVCVFLEIVSFRHSTSRGVRFSKFQILRQQPPKVPHPEFKKKLQKATSISIMLFCNAVKFFLSPFLPLCHFRFFWHKFTILFYFFYQCDHILCSSVPPFQISFLYKKNFFPQLFFRFWKKTKRQIVKLEWKVRLVYKAHHHHLPAIF